MPSKPHCQIWRQLMSRDLHARGVSTWSINLDKSSGYDFARKRAPSVGRG